ncbi:SPOR domain-containing protein [Fodinibius sediminis]|uniref:Sporulation related domain-containing protein n=1 Tax=Fodinibius sediminis TaxID=1214077 RepID=A0A521AQ24_9BACT|nr:SPOR domain-containing protein [Fodinibius sediminis]SMO36895.1 Sporulation related domain-containing protein [Fodinibius sediminis]
MTTVDREQLITLLAQRTGMDRDQVHLHFVKLIDQIQQTGSGRDSFDIEGFGRFTTVGDHLEFEPSDILSMEINNKYAGMRPIELIGAFKEPDGDDIPVADPPREEYEPLSEAESPEEQQDREEVGVLQKQEQEPPPAPPVAQPEDAASPAEDRGDEPAEPEAVPVDEVKEEEQTGPGEKSLNKDPLGKAVVIIVVILTLAVVGWLAYDLGLFGSAETGGGSPSPGSNPPVEQQQSGTQQSEVTPNIGAAEEDNASPAEQAGLQETQDNLSPASSVNTETYGLYGEPSRDLTNGFYTIVVHSLRTMELAEEKKQILVDEGFRTRINEADVNGRTYYRVGVGQFATVKAAQEAIRELPEPYKSNNFINRF